MGRQAGGRRPVAQSGGLRALAGRGRPGHLLTWLAAAALTLAVEVPLVVAVVWRQTPEHTGRALAVVAVANVVTHAALWTVWPWVPLRYLVKLAVLETAVWLAEAGAYRGAGLLDTRRALLWSFLANAATTLLGLALQS